MRAPLVALLVVLGCTPAPCVEGRAVGACAACVDLGGRPGTARLVARADALIVAVEELDLALEERCVAMAEQLALREAPPSEAACETVREEMARRVEELFPQEVRLAIAKEPARCFVAYSVARACAAEAGEAEAPLLCTGEELGACDGRCEGTCHAPAGPCSGTCSDFCEGSCEGLCIGECDGECAIRDRDDRCVAACEGTCALGACDGACAGSCTGICAAESTESCGGLCVGACAGTWAPACDAPIEVGSRTAGLACTAAAALAAECPEPEVRVRGPEVEEPRHHALVDQLVLTASRHFAPLYALRARVALLRAPWSSALEEVLAIAARAEPGGCVADRAEAVRAAVARLQTIEASLGALIAAGEASVGTLVD